MTAAVPRGGEIKGGRGPSPTLPEQPGRLSGRTRGRFVDRWFPVLLVLPLAVLMLVLSVYPVLRLIPLSFQSFGFSSGEFQESWNGLGNLRRLVNDRDLPQILWNTLVFVMASVAIEFVLALILAIAVNRDNRVTRILKAIFVLPILVPPIVIGTVWRLMYNPDVGIINQVLRTIGLPAQNWLSDPDRSLLAIIVVDVWHWTSFVFLILLAGMQAIPREPVEAAKVDGASSWQLLTTITLPLLRPAMFVAILFRTIFAFKVFDEVFLLSGGGPGNSSEVWSLYIYRVEFRFSDFGYGALLSLLTIVFVLIALLVSRRLVRARGGEL